MCLLANMYTVFVPIATNSDSSFDSDGELFVEPDLDCGMLLEELEDEIDGWEKDFAPASTAAPVHSEYRVR